MRLSAPQVNATPNYPCHTEKYTHRRGKAGQKSSPITARSMRVAGRASLILAHPEETAATYRLRVFKTSSFPRPLTQKETTVTNYREWLDRHKEAARTRRGRPIYPPAKAAEGNFHRSEAKGWDHIKNYRGWKRGEIVNPMTGEIVANCLSVAKLAEKLNVTSTKLIDHVETLGWVNRVLSVENIPMICAPDLRKPRYSRRPEATRRAIEGGYCIPITVSRSVGNEERINMILITPDGQKLLSTRLSHVRPEGKARDIVKRLLREGHSQAAIVELTGYSQQSVSYHFRRFQSAA